MAGTPPNVIVCLCDQLRSFEVGCYGNDIIRTPNIDRLCQNGVWFDVACANNPVCTPSRSILLSGQYSRSCTGVLNNRAHTPPSLARECLKDPTLPETFRHAGYDTALIGKWHVRPDPGIVGFDHTLYPHQSHRNTQQTYFRRNGEGFVVEEFAPDFEIREVETYLESHQQRPFFLY